MGASASARRDGESPEDATAEEQDVETIEVQDSEDVDAKALQKNGQISSLNGKAEDIGGEFTSQAETEPKEVGQTEPVSQKEDDSEMRQVVQEEVTPPVVSEKEEKEPEADEMSSTDKTAEELKPEETSEVGFKKIFRFVGFKVTLKKDKNEKDDPVQLLTVKKDEGEPGTSDVVVEAAVEESKAEAPTEDTKEQDVAEHTEKECTMEEPAELSAVKETEPEVKEEAPEEPSVEEPSAEKPVANEASGEANEASGEVTEATEQASDTEEATQEAAAEKETEASSESPSSSPAVQETQSPLKRFFTQGIFSNLRKKTSFKKTKEDESTKESAIKGETKETEETAESPDEDADKITEETDAQQNESPATEDSKTEAVTEQVSDIVVEQKEDEIKVAITVEADIPQTSTEKVTESLPTEDADKIAVTTVKAEDAVEGRASPEEIPAAVTTEPELLSSQEKNKAQGSPLKKLLTGTGLKKLSYKKQKGKKDAETKLTESGEHASEQLQSSTESAEGLRGESSPSSPEESTEHIIGEPEQAETSPEHETEGERKKDGILPWASFKKLVTPKKRVKKSSESEDDTAEKPKSATLSSTDSAGFEEKPEEPKAHEQEQKVEASTEEPKKKIDTSVSWEALICVGSSKKRARKTSDSDDEAPKIEEETQRSVAEQSKTVEMQLGSSQEADHENLTSSPEQPGSPSEGDGVSTWESLKRLVTPRRKAKVEDKVEESQTVTASEQIPSDSEIPKEESSFSLKKLIPGRKKKKSDGKQEQVSSDEAGKSLGSGEEDSDTPAVVPLSEYDSEQVQMEETPSKMDTIAVMEKPTETVEAEKPKAEVITDSDEVKPNDAAPMIETQVKAATDIEERLPSWIPATPVEESQETTECITKQPLSDIPEEATPKSMAEEGSRDDTIAEDIVELTSEAVTAVEQAPEVSYTEETTEMVSAVSRITESPGTSGDTTPVQAEYDMEKTEAILQEAVQTITLTENVQSVMMTDLQQESVAVSVTPQVMENATVEETVVLVLHQKSEATAICTGLNSQEIEFAEENTLQTSVESITEVGEAMPTEMVLEDKTGKFEVAGVGETHVCVAEVLDIKTELRDPEPMAEVKQMSEQVDVNVETVHEIQQSEVLLMGEVKDMAETEHAELLQEQKAVSVASINLVQGESEVLEEPIVAENTPKTDIEGLLETAIEESVCVQFVHITEVSPLNAEKVQEFEDIKKEVADSEITPLEEVVQCVKEEVSASMPEHHVAEPAEIQEASIPVVAPAAEILVSEETTSIISPLSESDAPKMAEIKDEVIMERIPSLKSIEGHEIQVEDTRIDISVAKVAIEADTEAASSSMTITVETVPEKVVTIPVIQADKIKEAKIEEAITTPTEMAIQNTEIEIIQTDQEKEAEIIEGDSTAVVEMHIQNVDTEAVQTEQVKGSEMVKDDGKAEAEVVRQSLDIEVMQAEPVKDAETIKEENIADAEVVVQQVDVDVLRTKQVEETEIEEDSKADDKVDIQKADQEVAETEQLKKASIKEDSAAVADMVVQKVDIEVVHTEKEKEAEITEEASTAVAETAVQSVETDMLPTEKEKEAEITEENSKAEAEVVGQNVVGGVINDDSKLGNAESEKENKTVLECVKHVQEAQTTGMDAPQDTTVIKKPVEAETQAETETSVEKMENEPTSPVPAQAVKEVQEKSEDGKVTEEPTIHMQEKEVKEKSEDIEVPEEPTGHTQEKEVKEKSEDIEVPEEPTGHTQEKEVKQISEDVEVPEEPVVQKQEEKTIIETVQVETVESIPCEAIQDDVVPVGLPCEGTSAEPPSKQEIGATLQDAEVKHQKEKVEEEKVSLRTPKESDKDKDKSESKELMGKREIQSDTMESKDEEDHKVQGEPQEDSRVTETGLCQDVHVLETVQQGTKEAKEEVQLAATVVRSPTLSVADSDSTCYMETEADHQSEVIKGETEAESRPEFTDSKNVQVLTEDEKEGCSQTQTMEEEKTQTVTYDQGKVEVCEQEVEAAVDLCQTVEVTQTVTEVQVTIEEKTMEVHKETVLDEEVPPTPLEDLEKQQSGDEAVTSKDVKSEETDCQKSPAEVAENQEILKVCGPPKTESKEESSIEASAGVQAETEATSQEELKEPPAAGSTAEGVKAAEQAIRSEALDLTGQEILETVNETESMSSDLMAAS